MCIIGNSVSIIFVLVPLTCIVHFILPLYQLQRVSSACYFCELCFELTSSVTTWPYIEVVGFRHMQKINVKNTAFPAHNMEACRGE